MNKDKFIEAKIKELPDGLFICFDFDSVHIQIPTDIDKAIVEIESLLNELKQIKIDKSSSKWKEEYESRERLNFQAEVTDGFAGEEKPINLNNYKFFE